MYIGIDLGGTNLKAAVVDDSGHIVHKNMHPTNADRGYNHVLSCLTNSIKTLLNAYKGIESIGVGVPGVVNPEGTILIAPNLHGWKNVELAKILKNEFLLPIAVDNDANAAAIAEFELGAGKDDDSFIYVTLGTGVGGCIIFNRKIFRGETGGAGEIGHAIINANDKIIQDKPYRTGIVEEYSGRNQITELGKKIISQYPDSLLHNYDRPDPFFISQAIEDGDQAARLIFSQVGFYLGIGLSSVVNILDISTLIFGGGISLSHHILLDTALTTIKQRAMPSIAPRINFKEAKFTKNAGIVGAAMLGKNSINR